MQIEKLLKNDQSTKKMIKVRNFQDIIFIYKENEWKIFTFAWLYRNQTILEKLTNTLAVNP